VEENELVVRESRRVFNRTFAVFVAFSVVYVLLMTIGLFTRPAAPVDDARRAEQITLMTRVLVVLLFFSATIINLGIRWTGRIIAGRRFRLSDPRRAVRAYAASQVACFAVYALFFAAAFYHRMAAAGEKVVFVAATLAAVLASFYFLRVPRYLLSAVFARDAAPPAKV
jgi:hypothetical protein